MKRLCEGRRPGTGSECGKGSEDVEHVSKGPQDLGVGEGQEVENNSEFSSLVVVHSQKKLGRRDVSDTGRLLVGY